MMDARCHSPDESSHEAIAGVIASDMLDVVQDYIQKLAGSSATGRKSIPSAWRRWFGQI
jgi:hypothetical protein